MSKSLIIAVALLGCASSGSARVKDLSVEQRTEQAFMAAAAVGDATPPCRDMIGSAAALAFVRYCREVSSATHPPCNTGNHCAIIVQHIRGMCHAAEAETLPCRHWSKATDWERIERRPAM